MATNAIELPAHIDPAAVRHCALFDRRLTYDNPYETIIPAIHQGPAVFFADNVMFRQPGWVVRRNADLREILADAEHFTKSGAYGLARLLGEDWNVIPTELDPPVHTAFRAALNPLFSPSRMIALDGRVRERARAFVDRFKKRGECELVREFAVVFPISIFLDLLGLPQDRLEQCYEWECGLIHGADMDTRIDSMRAIKALLLETIAARKANPGDDLISQALTLEVDGRKWTDDEIFGYCVNLYLGGLDTVTANIGLHFRHLATHPDDQQSMRNNSPQQNVVAIEELLRAYAVTSTNRICIKPYDVGGERIMPGDYVITSPAIAGRDPEAYEAPQDIRLDRRPSHLTLGHGIHRCLGQHLARRELQTAIEVFLGEIPSFHIEPGHKVEYFLGNILHVPELPLTWN